MRRRGPRKICALLIVWAGVAALYTDVWPALTPIGGQVVVGACLFFAAIFWSADGDVPLPRGQEHDR
ncbi:hypothetical protein [Paenibacillus sp.]|uniref:hypothetical protein n=1 Tax=Paenibacillus sp. TaxID=58172 RepID=UPI002D230445|nr:hypothetical protein [Paenibacillus sp.]HZG58149.1 hypothetical protein [Paenibacillus sp.]